MRHPHDVQQTVGMQQRAADGGQMILHRDHLHFLRKTAFVLDITGQGFLLDKEFTAHVILRWYSSFITVRVVHIFAKIKLQYGDLRDCTKVALRLVRKALDAVKCCNGKVIHPEKITVPGCSSACPEGTG